MCMKTFNGDLKFYTGETQSLKGMYKNLNFFK